MKTLDDFDFKNKTVLLRSDLNSDVVGKKVIMGERIRASVETIRELKKKKAKIVILAHQGKPGQKDFLGLKQHAKYLSKFTKVRFVEDIIGKKAVDAIKNLKKGEAILLDNVRFLKQEFKPGKNKFVKTLLPFVDIYVNDAFSVCHRKQTSIVSFPRYLPSCAGRLLDNEVNSLRRIKMGKCLYILGGAKPEDNIKLLKGNKVLTCGLFGQSCLIAKGKNLGRQNKYLLENIKCFDKVVKKLILKLRKIKHLETPVDFAVKFRKKRRELLLYKFPNEFEIFDIGEKTIEKYVEIIKHAKTIYMKGPAGDCSDKQFCKGTFEILKTVSKNKGFTMIGGGHLSDAISKSKIDKKKFSHISLSGGALLAYVAGEKLPGLKVLK